LVTSDTNGKRDVYEWENGSIFLISSGTSTAPSRYLDSSESGGDVFFETAAGLVPGDNDNLRDAYDARIPQAGDNPPPSAVPCQGDVCQGPPSVPQLLTPAASAVFNGLGNIPPEAAKPEVQPKRKAKKKKVKKKRKSKKHSAKSGSRHRKNRKRGK
jgi:hypothetical protein